MLGAYWLLTIIGVNFTAALRPHRRVTDVAELPWTFLEIPNRDTDPSRHSLVCRPLRKKLKPVLIPIAIEPTLNNCQFK